MTKVLEGRICNETHTNCNSVTPWHRDMRDTVTAWHRDRLQGVSIVEPSWPELEVSWGDMTDQLSCAQDWMGSSHGSVTCRRDKCATFSETRHEVILLAVTDPDVDSGSVSLAQRLHAWRSTHCHRMSMRNKCLYMLCQFDAPNWSLTQWVNCVTRTNI